MILLISAKQQQLESPVEERFGRSEWFIKFDTETKHWEACANPGASRSGARVLLLLNLSSIKKPAL
jgi:predicted Fe-Mo cluster-binding NifX family protein